MTAGETARIKKSTIKNMLVETYEVTEQANLSEMEALASDGEIKMLIDQLGLTGQQELAQGTGDSPVPYRVMTAEEQIVFSTVFPERSKVENYKDGMIPLRVLQIIAWARTVTLEDFAYLEIWHPKKGYDDPLLVARKSSYQDPVYILARWGNALIPFEELKEKALEILKVKAKAKLEKAKSEIETALQSVDARVMAEFHDGRIFNPYFSL